MLQPKKTKFRKQQKGRMKGNAQRGNQLVFGSFGIKSLQSKWITSRQIEAARIAVTRYMQREGQVWVRIFPDNQCKNLMQPGKGKEIRKDLWPVTRKNAVRGGWRSLRSSKKTYVWLLAARYH